jgi:hypothetical protein
VLDSEVMGVLVGFRRGVGGLGLLDICIARSDLI